MPLSAVLVVGAFFAAAAMTRPALGPLPASVRANWAWSVNLTLGGQPWRTVTAVALTRDTFMLGSLTATTTLLLAVTERLVGAGVTVMTWALGAAFGYVGTTVLVTALDRMGWELASRAAATLDYGPSAGTAALSALIVARMRSRAVTVVLGGGLLIGSALHHQIADVEHLIAFGLVLLIAGVMDQLPDHRDGYSSAARRRRQRANEPGSTGSQ